MNENAQMSDYQDPGYRGNAVGKSLSGVGAGRLDPQPVQQPEVQRQVSKLLHTAEELDATAAKLVARIEQITRPEPKTAEQAAEGSLAACPATILGRDLDSINLRIRNTMATLQSTIQRIEL